jgi:hypothetical protein
VVWLGSSRKRKKYLNPITEKGKDGPKRPSFGKVQTFRPEESSSGPGARYKS